MKYYLTIRSPSHRREHIVLEINGITKVDDELNDFFDEHGELWIPDDTTFEIRTEK